MSKKPTVLMILDGYGLNENKEANAVAEAKTPVMDKLMKEQGQFSGGFFCEKFTGRYQDREFQASVSFVRG